jgi:hypothetical protein
MPNNFLPPDYDVPTMSNWMKFEDGENRFRILSTPIIGWEDWDDKKPIRFHMDSKPDEPIDFEKPIKHFWAMVVWNYNKNKLQVLEITQNGVQKKLKALAKDADWGPPFDYDIKVTRSGSGLKTEYEVNPVPHKPVAQEISDQYANTKINLDAMFSGEDPFTTPF